MSRIGIKIKNLRTTKGMTQKQLAKAIGVAEKFIDEVETGRKVISAELLRKVSKVLEQNISEEMVYETGGAIEASKQVKEVKKPEKKEVQQVWEDALDSVLKTVPVYEYDLAKVLTTRQLPVISNKVEGFPKDKVFFIEIQDNDLIGFRVIKGDIAFCHAPQEFENNWICLVEHGGHRFIRQIKKLDSDKVLLISNKGTLNAEAVPAKSIKVLARLIKLEIKL